MNEYLHIIVITTTSTILNHIIMGNEYIYRQVVTTISTILRHIITVM